MKTELVLTERDRPDSGFSLLEVIGVIAVLSVLTAISLPHFLAISDLASVAASKQRLLDIFTYCESKAMLSPGSPSNFTSGPNQDFVLSAIPSTLEIFDIADVHSLPPLSARQQCVSISNGSTVRNNFVAIPRQLGKFPKLFVGFNSNKLCQNGSYLNHSSTFNLGCAGILSLSGIGGDLSQGVNASDAVGYWQD